MHNKYPVVDKDCSNGIYEPLPQFSKDDWKNKNRIPRTEKEKADLIAEVLGSDCFYPAQHIVMLEEYNPAKDMAAAINASTISHWWNMGRIVSMGNLAFDKNSFPMGATASYNDYVIFDMHAQRRTRFNNAAVLLVRDLSIDGIVKDPAEFIKAGRYD